MRRYGCVLIAFVVASSAFAVDAPVDTIAKTVLAKAGIGVGVCEMPRAGDGKLATSLARAGVTLVDGLAADAKAAEAARAPAADAGVLGTRVMIETGVPSALPLADWLADLVVVPDATDANLKEVLPAEVRRVLAPYRGVAVVGNPGGGKSGLTKTALETWVREIGGSVEINEDASGLWAVIRNPP